MATSKQLEAYSKLKDDTTRSVCYGGAAGGGKSWLGCEWLMVCADSIPGFRGFIGRDELKKIKQSTYITWHKVAKHHNYYRWHYNGQDNKVIFDNGSEIDFLDLRLKPSDPMFERFGSLEYTAGWIEEAGEVDFGAYEVLMTRVGRHLNKEQGLFPKMLITCNPKKNWLYNDYYKPHSTGKLPEDKAFIQAFVDDNPYLSDDYVQNLKNTKDKVKRERLLLGDWEYDDDPSSLIDYDSITDYFSNEHVKGDGLLYITADIARFGDDSTIIRVWDGMRVLERIQLDDYPITGSAMRIKQTANSYGIPMSKVLVDEDGIGGGVKDMLKCKGFIANSSPVKVKGRQENYGNLKSQCAFRMAARICNKEVYEEIDDETARARITEELEQVRAKNVDKDGKQYIEPKDAVKKRIGRSPDDWDSIMMREYFELQRKSVKAIA